MKVCIFLANGVEEAEAINTIDILRRADIDTDIISIHKDKEILGSHDIIIKSDYKIDEINNFSKYNCFILPGGKGVNELLKSDKLKKIILEANNDNKYIAAICAAPKILLEWNILKNHKIVHYPGVFEYKHAIDKDVYADGNIITGTSVGTSIKFALLIIEKLISKEKSDTIKKTLVIK